MQIENTKLTISKEQNINKPGYEEDNILAYFMELSKVIRQDVKSIPLLDGEDPEQKEGYAIRSLHKKLKSAFERWEEEEKQTLTRKGKRATQVFESDPRTLRIGNKKKIIPLLDLMDEMGLDMMKPENQALMKERFFPEGSKSKTGHIPLIVKVDKEFIALAMERLNISRMTFFRKIGKMEQYKWLRWESRDRRGASYYSYGYCYSFQTKDKNGKVIKEGWRFVMYLNGKDKNNILEF
jgi:hypothetical protein